MDFSAPQIDYFEHIIAVPSIQSMLDLSWQDFQRFVEYLFTCASYKADDVSHRYFPNGPGVDLNLHTPTGKLVGRVEVRRIAPPTKLDVGDVSAFWGMLDVAGGKTGYLVTTSDFTDPAQAFANTPVTREKLWLINGTRLLRYIAYIRGSRGKNAEGHRRIPSPVSPHYLYYADALTKAQPQPAPQRPTICAISNNKGGVAKSTTALNLGVALAEMKQQRVLLIDMDGQGSLSFALPRPLSEDTATPATLADYFAGYRTLRDLITPTEFPQVHLIRAHPDLHAMDSGGIAKPESELRFVAAVQSLTQFDWIILDTPPARTQYTRHALAAADKVIIPVVIEALATNGVNGMLDTYGSMRALVGRKPSLLGALITRWKDNAFMRDGRPALEDSLRGQSVHVFATSIPNDDNVDQAIYATSHGGKKSLFNFRKRSGPAALGYQAFVEEVLSHDDSK